MKILKRLFMAFPMIAMMIIIFMFSAETGESSGGLSLRIAKAFSHALEGLMNVDTDVIHLIIRKCAHMTEYAFLYVTVMWALNGLFGEKIYIYAYLVTCLYAVTDELHQSFIDGRCGTYKDVIIDGIGALIALSLYRLHMINKKRKNNVI